MNITTIVAAIGLGAMAAAPPAPVPAPSFNVGDSWVFDQTIERGVQGYDQRRLDLKVERTGGDTILVGLKRDGAPGAYEDHIVGADWSLRRIMDGKEASTARPFSFPMTPGEKWTVDYADPTRRGTQTSLHVHRTYRVVGWEDVTVPAGIFHAIKVEASGMDQATIDVPTTVVGSATSSSAGAATMTRSQTGGIRPLTVKFHAEAYYVPSVKNYVKSVEEQFNTDDVLVNRQTRTLVSFQPGA